jgi:hypothetical protein
MKDIVRSLAAFKATDEVGGSLLPLFAYHLLIEKPLLLVAE